MYGRGHRRTRWVSLVDKGARELGIARRRVKSRDRKAVSTIVISF